MDTKQQKTGNHVPTLIAVCLALAACSDPTKFNKGPVEVEEEEICEASADWLPNTPALPLFLPVPHPAGECPFYRSAWQNFLIAMQPDANGRPALVDPTKFPTIDQAFVHGKPHPANRSYLGDIKQAGARQILIDQNGNTLYYGIAVNQAFADFVKANGLDTAAGLAAYPKMYPNLTFPAGIVEFKSAWQVVEGTADEIAAQTKDFISMQTTVPTLSQKLNTVTGEIELSEDRDTPRTVTVRLLAIHVVGTLTGHPEFVWGSFEHSTGTPDTKAADGHRDVAPIVPDDKNPTNDDPANSKNTIVVSDQDHILYKAGTTANVGNKPFSESDLHLVGQKFLNPDMSPQQTSIYRMFPASKSNTVDPDAAITSLNHNVEQLFTMAQAAGTLAANDKRGHYRLVGAQWMDKPRYFDVNKPLQNDASSPMVAGPHIAQDGTLADAVSLAMFTADIRENGSDSEFSILAGEDRMSSTAMESFTQAPQDFNNCFTCHNTQAITARGIPLDRDPSGKPVKLLDPGLLNVSHILSQFLLEEYEDGSFTPSP